MSSPQDEISVQYLQSFSCREVLLDVIQKIYSYTAELNGYISLLELDEKLQQYNIVVDEPSDLLVTDVVTKAKTDIAYIKIVIESATAYLRKTAT